jgi:hypothetical protein
MERVAGARRSRRWQGQAGSKGVRPSGDDESIDSATSAWILIVRGFGQKIAKGSDPLSFIMTYL